MSTIKFLFFIIIIQNTTYIGGIYHKMANKINFKCQKTKFAH